MPSVASVGIHHVRQPPLHGGQLGHPTPKPRAQLRQLPGQDQNSTSARISRRSPPPKLKLDEHHRRFCDALHAQLLRPLSLPCKNATLVVEALSDQHDPITKVEPIYRQAGSVPRVRALKNMKNTIAILALAALGITTVKAGVHVGVGLGIPVPAPAVVAPAPVVVAPAPLFVAPLRPAPVIEVVPACPTPGYIWVGGSWGWCNNRRVWTRGHWGAPVHWGYGYRAAYHGPYHGSYHGGNGHR